MVPGDATRSLLVAVFVTVLLVSMLSAGGVVDGDASPAAEIDAATAAVVDHQTDWYVFAPEPRTTDRYYVFPRRPPTATSSTSTTIAT
ncbi:hypothetical protein D8S78_02540 [Natrialba swarupiae]|nr:hypothetical protein [Natrialba swarupiae]